MINGINYFINNPHNLGKNKHHIYLEQKKLPIYWKILNLILPIFKLNHWV